MIRNDYYVYLHLRRTDGKVFYVGKGTRRRAWSMNRKNPHWRRTVAKHGYDVILIHRDMTESCALSFERALIRAYSSPELTNLTDGGEGASGYSHTLEGRAKMSAAWQTRVVSDETRLRLSAFQRGRKHSPEHVLKQAEAQKGKTYSEETKAKIGAAHRGKVISEAHRSAMSKRVECSNGMVFPSVTSAALWVRSDCGYPKASKTNIIYCLKGVTSVAYGLRWSYVE